jgi:hypothetical protein
MTHRTLAFATAASLFIAIYIGSPILLYGALLLFIALAAIRIVQHFIYSHYWHCLRQWDRGLCPKCGYSLQHLPEDRCPECGAHPSRLIAQAHTYIDTYHRNWTGPQAPKTPSPESPRP